MATRTENKIKPRPPLTRERVLQAAVELADRNGISSLTMRNLAQELGVEAMSLYHYVAKKEDILDGIVDLVVGEVQPIIDGSDWKQAMRQRVLSARASLLRHPWASAVIVSRVNMTPTMIEHMDSIAGILRRGGFSVDLTHHAFHVMGSRMLGFVQELYDDSDELANNPDVAAVMLQQMAEKYPYITELAMEVSHDDDSIVGTGCDDQFEFEFGLDLILDGLERLRDSEKKPAPNIDRSSIRELL